jgi:hypothetical protein
MSTNAMKAKPKSRMRFVAACALSVIVLVAAICLYTWKTARGDPRIASGNTLVEIACAGLFFWIVWRILSGKD